MSETTPAKATKSKPKWLSYLIKYGIPLVITVGLCYLLFTGIDFNEMIALIRRDCDFTFIGIALFISIFSHVFRGMRWGIQLRAVGVDAPLWVLVLSIFGTYAVNLVFPRLGELWRTGWIAERQKAPFATVFGSMVADRLSDTVMVALLIGLAAIVASGQLVGYLSQNMESYERMMAVAASPWLWVGLVALVAVTWWLVWHLRDTAVMVKVRGALAGLWQGFAAIATMKGKGPWLGLTLAIWGCYFFQLYIAFFAFPVTAEVVRTYGWTAVLVCFVLTSISMGVPSNGGIGPWQWAIIFGLSMYPVPGLTKEYATSFANLVMGSQTLLLIVLGIFTFITISINKHYQHKNS